MKKSFILHIDSLCILDKMTDEQAGKFIKIIHQYQLTKELPEMDLLMEMAITPFINQFFRDEKGYERVLERNRKNGEKGGRPRLKPKKPSGLKKTHSNPKNPEEPKKADSDSVNDSDSVSDNERGKSAEAQPTQKDFRQLTEKEFYAEVAKFSHEYAKELLRSFYNHWSEKNPKGKMKFQLEDTWELSKRLAKWKATDERFNKKNGNHVEPSPTFHPALKNKIQ